MEEYLIVVDLSSKHKMAKQTICNWAHHNKFFRGNWSSIEARYED